jgi:hypothetical protein
MSYNDNISYLKHQYSCPRCAQAAYRTPVLRNAMAESNAFIPKGLYNLGIMEYYRRLRTMHSVTLAVWHLTLPDDKL